LIGAAALLQEGIMASVLFLTFAVAGHHRGNLIAAA